MNAKQKYIKDLKKSDMTAEFECLNILQGTKWRINRKVYHVLNTVWERRLKIGKLPDPNEKVLENYPFSVEPQKIPKDSPDYARYREWASNRVQAYEFNATQTGKKIQVSMTLEMAKEYLDIPELYFAWNSDFRHRKYPLSTFLQPQAAEWSKALLEFADGVEVKTEEDARWLAIHGANVFGNDKLPLEDRVKWAYSYKKEAELVAKDPFEYMHLWTDADKPFSFLAWCFEWAEYSKSITGAELGRCTPFYTHLPCAADGSSNGIQHLSAILRDKRGAKSVNLTKSDKPQDIYGDVAKSTKEKLEQFIKEVESKPEYAREEKEVRELVLAKKWLQFGITRKICKRPTMIIPYAGTQQACRMYVEEAYKEYVEDGAEAVFETKQVMKACIFLTRFIWESIASVIQASKSVMKYIQEIAGLYGSVNVPMEWITPTGALVRPLYFDRRDQNIATVVQGHIHRYKIIHQNEDKIDKRKMRTASAPNVIHSLDAAALTLTVITANEVDGIKDFAMVHDSFATHSPNMGTLSRVLRECFVEIYTHHDIMQELRDHAIEVLVPLGVPIEEIPVPPEKGDLDINEVLESEYFFS